MIGNELSKETLVNKVKSSEKNIDSFFGHLGIFVLDQSSLVEKIAGY